MPAKLPHAAYGVDPEPAPRVPPCRFGTFNSSDSIGRQAAVERGRRDHDLVDCERPVTNRQVSRPNGLPIGRKQHRAGFRGLHCHRERTISLQVAEGLIRRLLFPALVLLISTMGHTLELPHADWPGKNRGATSHVCCYVELDCQDAGERENLVSTRFRAALAAG